MTTPSDARPVIRGIPIDDIGFADTVHLIVAWAEDGSGGYVCTPNVDYIVRAQWDAPFRAALLGARLRVPDGMGIVYGSRLAGCGLRSTVTGRLIPVAVAPACARRSIAVGLFGGAPSVAAKAARALVGSSGVDVSIAFGPSMRFEPGSKEDAAAVERIQESGAKVLFVALGAPKQETWMMLHSTELPGLVLVGVGQAFDVISGRLPPAPAWATQLGLEWLFRMVREPSRLAPRYLKDDPRFFWWMLVDRVNLRRKSG